MTLKLPGENNEPKKIMNLEQVYASRPFKSRNAEDFELNQVLDLFVNPSSELVNPFDYENIIVKGRMGSGKTMYLRANYAFHLYSIVPSLINGDALGLH